MCEVLAVRWPEPRPFSVLAGWARAMEYYGSGRFGWGVAWVADGQVRAHLDTGQMAEDPAVGQELAAVESDRFLVHFRRPTLLSTIQLADTQPFVSREKNFAFVHNGLFKERDTVRPDYAGRLKGSADSEIGFCMLQDFIDDGVSASDALAMVAGSWAATRTWPRWTAPGPSRCSAGTRPTGSAVHRRRRADRRHRAALPRRLAVPPHLPGRDGPLRDRTRAPAVRPTRAGAVPGGDPGQRGAAAPAARRAGGRLLLTAIRL